MVKKRPELDEIRPDRSESLGRFQSLRRAAFVRCTAKGTTT